MCHALVIEDDAFIAMAIEDALWRGGVDTIDIAATEQEAVAAADRHAPDFIASDVQLLEGTGPAAVSAILARMGTIPVVFITATPEACEALRDRADVLLKPVTSDAIIAAFRRLVPAYDRRPAVN